MERLGPINLQRVKWVASDQGIDPADLGDYANLPAKAWQKVLRGEDGLTYAQLQTLGKRVGRQPLFFLDPKPVDESSVRSVQFRSTTEGVTELSGELKKLIERSEKQRDVYVALRQESEDPGPAKFSPPIRPGDTPEVAAVKVRAWLKLPTEPKSVVTFDTYRTALEDRDVLVLLATGYAGDWKFPGESSAIGFSIYFDAAPLIMVRNCEWKSRELFTLAHELGHLVLHRKGTVTRESDLWVMRGREREANAFAGRLLVPDSFLGIVPALGNDVTLYDDRLSDYRKAWGVSTEVILRRLLDASRLPQPRYTEYRAWREKQPLPTRPSSGSRGYRDREPLHRFGKRYVRTVLDAISSDRITIDRGSDYLDRMKIEYVRKLGEYVKGL